MLWFRTRVIKISPQNKFPSTFLCGNFRDLKNLRFHFHLGIIRGFEEFRVHRECDSLFKEKVTSSCLQSAQQPNSLFHHHVNLNFTPLRICSLKLDNYQISMTFVKALSFQVRDLLYYLWLVRLSVRKNFFSFSPSHPCHPITNVTQSPRSRRQPRHHANGVGIPKFVLAKQNLLQEMF